MTHRAAALLVLVLLGATGVAAADQTLSGPAPLLPVGGCVLRGTARMPKDLMVFDAAREGKPVARFTGTDSALVAFEFPSGPGAQRVRIQTGTGLGSFRINGYIEAGKLPLHTAQRAAVVEGHVWIEAGEPIELLGETGARLRIRKTLRTPLQVTLTSAVACSGVALTPAPRPGWAVPGAARGYVLRADELVLYDEPTAERRAVLLLRKAPEAPGVLFWSTERRGGFVRVQHHAALVVDAWVKSGDLKALPPGETMDQLATAHETGAAPRLSLQGKARLVKTTGQAPIRGAARDTAPVIGVVEPETEIYVVDVVAGWASVLPRALNIAPAGDGQFWVEAKSLGLDR
jgi:hypothetical protein